jgi:hypothetical protein
MTFASGDELDPPHAGGAIASVIRAAFKLALKRNVIMIAHEPAMRHRPSRTEMWARTPVYG